MRWKILTTLFFARMAMAFQFATIGALGPLYETTFQVTSASLGILIGLYFLPGVVVALPGCSLAARFGDKRVVVFGLALMALGAAVMASVDTWTAQITGRIIAGTGGVFLNVSMTKMVTDWFAGREIATAMAVFVNSWPAGIATALMVMPLLADRAGLSMAVWMAFGFILFGIGLMLLFYQSPEEAGNAKVPRGTTHAATRLRRSCLRALPGACSMRRWPWFSVLVRPILSNAARPWFKPARESAL